MKIDGIVIVASVPLMFTSESPALFTMITAMAPAFWAFLTFTVKLQVPRSIRAILPAIEAALVRAPQQSVAEGPLTVSSVPWTTMPESPFVKAGPKEGTADE